jgi:uncharacterized cupin superfamily protein
MTLLRPAAEQSGSNGYLCHHRAVVEHRDGGWFVVNARKARWRGGNGRTPICSFEHDRPFPELGINLTVLEPGRLGSLYHAEGAQENFLILSGTCLLLIEGEERKLRTRDFVHCPPDTAHTFVAIDGACLVLQVGARPARSIVYPMSELAQRYGAGVQQETTSVDDAYGKQRREPVSYSGWLD